MAVDGSGNVYVADLGNHTIRKITPDGEVSTFAGTANTLGFDDGTGAAARFLAPVALAIDSAGVLYVASGGPGIRKVTAAGVVTEGAALMLTSSAKLKLHREFDDIASGFFRLFGPIVKA